MPLLQVGVATGLPLLTQLSNGVPKGYLRVLVFDKDSALVSQVTEQLQGTALNRYDSLRVRVVLPQDGYVSAYVGNESDVDVYFDDIRVVHGQGLQVQENSYDPTGLELAGVSRIAPGLRLKNLYQFNGKENQLDLGLNWNHQDWRFFDYQLGRWHVVDPEIENGQESWTAYSFSFGNAIRYNDPNGRWPGEKVIKETITAAKEKMISLAANALGTSRSDVLYAKHHPRAAIAQGRLSGNGHQITTDSRGAGPTSNNIGLNSTLEGNHGGAENALRHIIWQALLTQKVGTEEAQSAEVYHGDGDPNVGGDNPTFDQLDSRADTFNNQVGRQIGVDNPGASPQEIALMALNKIRDGEAKVVGQDKAGKLTTLTSSISGEVYDRASHAIKQLDNNGLAPAQANAKLSDSFQKGSYIIQH